MPDQLGSSPAGQTTRTTGQRLAQVAHHLGTRLWSSRRRRLSTLVASAVLLASAVAGGTYLWWFQDPGAQPGGKGARKLVIAYIDALADGDMNEACKLLHPRVTTSMGQAEGGCPGAMRAQIGDRLSRKDRGRVAGIDVGEATVEGRTARVEVSSGSSAAKKSTVIVERVDGRWRVLED
ncbi:DUF4878 domain-containing protein [Streptomyces olivoreticuli]|uniref:DUF4878 domain-containing protein n=1 Tax=Streptomyces olivoreticuli TaxID=68246 RepID=UPI0013C310E2|nr:DUF4878 domain-containing protein [Streptomyces olivoreticuli]